MDESRVIHQPQGRVSRTRPIGIALCLTGTLLYGGFSLWRGQDANWDLQNYHDYAGYALLHWRYRRDVAAADIQTFFNPGPYVIPYLLHHHLGPRIAAFALGMVHALIIWIVWGLTRRLMPGPALKWRALGLVTAVTGGLTLSEVGTSFCDLLLATLPLGALWLILPGDCPARPALRHAAAGLLMGLATGFKLTNGLFAVGLAVAILMPPTRSVTRRLAAFATGGLLGLLAGTGWWSLYLWQRFGNPIFPLLNATFKSPDAIIWNFTDPTYRPHTVWDAVIVPWRWAIGDPAGAEIPFRDPRIALAVLLILLAAAMAILRPGRLDPAASARLLRPLAFFAVSCALWSALFGIARYAVPLEICAGLLVVALAAQLLPAAAFVGPALSLFTLLWTVPGDWGHRPWTAAVQKPHFPAPLDQPATFVLADIRLSYLASYAPAKSVFYGPSQFLTPPGSQFVPAMTDKILHPGPGGAWVLTHGGPVTDEQQERGLYTRFGLAPGPDCMTLQTLGWDEIKACRLVPAQ